MSDEIAHNPNQGFENYAKEFSLRIELLRAAGEFAKATADARLTDAKTLDQLERTRTTAAINRSLNRALTRLEQDQRKYDREIKKTERHTTEMARFMAGRVPIDPNTLNNRVGSIEWFLEHGGDLMVLARPIPVEARGVEQWDTISVTHNPEALPADVDTLAALLQYMRARLAYPVAGRLAHVWLIGVLQGVADAKGAIVAKLEKALADARAGQYGPMHELLPFLKISGE